jgi:hypothetical protein
MSACIECGSVLVKRNSKYCSNVCQADFQYMQYISKWKVGTVDGNCGIHTRRLSAHLTRYLRNKFRVCSLCGWDEMNPVTKRVPLEIDHIKGDAENNTENNLRLICPNCHSLSSNFRNLNYGNGRARRRLKYIKISQ